MRKQLDATAQIVIEFDAELVTEDEAVELVNDYLILSSKFATEEETRRSKSVSIGKLEIYHVANAVEEG